MAMAPMPQQVVTKVTTDSQQQDQFDEIVEKDVENKLSRDEYL